MKVKINKFTYEILETENKEDERLKLNDVYAIGITRCNDQQIIIYNNLSEARFRMTLIHELTHAFIDAYGFWAHSEKFSHEDIAEFVSTYADDIVRIAEKYIENRYATEKRRDRKKLVK